MPTAVITGASRGLGRALATALARDGWSLVLDARDAAALRTAAADLVGATMVAAISGDVRDAPHRTDLAGAAARLGPVDLLVNNASDLGPSPLPPLIELGPVRLAEILAANLVAPLALFQSVRPHLAPGAAVINVTSDASVEAYPGWGGYGASKAGLDHLTAVLAVEHPDLRVWAVDPGDMQTQMHQDAFPREDISDRPLPEEVVPAFLDLLATRPPSGRVRAADLLPAVAS